MKENIYLIIKFTVIDRKLYCIIIANNIIESYPNILTV